MSSVEQVTEESNVNRCVKCGDFLYTWRFSPWYFTRYRRIYAMCENCSRGEVCRIDA